MTAKSPYLQVSYAETNRLLAEPYQRIVVTTIAAAMFCIPLFSGGYFLHLMNLCFIAVIGAVGINLFTGYCGQLSLGQASFLAIGAFTTAILSQRFGVALLRRHPGELLRGGAGGGLHRRPSAFRFRGIYLAITTLAMHYAIIYVLTNYQAIVGPSAIGRHHRSAHRRLAASRSLGARLVLCAVDRRRACRDVCAQSHADLYRPRLGRHPGPRHRRRAHPASMCRVTNYLLS